MSWGNYRKVQTFFCSNRERSLCKKKIYKDGNESAVTMPYKIKFTNTARFMATSLLNLVG